MQCIQDQPHVQLYTVVSTLEKGGVTLPVYRCAQGSTFPRTFFLLYYYRTMTMEYKVARILGVGRDTRYFTKGVNTL